MKLFSKIIQRIRLRDMQKNEARVNEDYQICERDGKLWLTFWGHPFIPQNFLKSDIVEVLNEIRKLHMDDKI